MKITRHVAGIAWLNHAARRNARGGGNPERRETNASLHQGLRWEESRRDLKSHPGSGEGSRGSTAEAAFFTKPSPRRHRGPPWLSRDSLLPESVAWQRADHPWQVAVCWSLLVERTWPWFGEFASVYLPSCGRSTESCSRIEASRHSRIWSEPLRSLWVWLSRGCRNIPGLRRIC